MSLERFHKLPPFECRHSLAKTQGCRAGSLSPALVLLTNYLMAMWFLGNEVSLSLCNVACTRKPQFGDQYPVGCRVMNNSLPSAIGTLHLGVNSMKVSLRSLLVLPAGHSKSQWHIDTQGQLTHDTMLTASFRPGNQLRLIGEADLLANPLPGERHNNQQTTPTVAHHDHPPVSRSPFLLCLCRSRSQLLQLQWTQRHQCICHCLKSLLSDSTESCNKPPCIPQLTLWRQQDLLYRAHSCLSFCLRLLDMVYYLCQPLSTVTI